MIRVPHSLRVGAGRKVLTVIVWLTCTAVVAGWVAHRHATTTGQSVGILRPASEVPRKTTSITRETLRPTIAGDGTVVQVGKHFEIHAAIANTDLAYRLSQSAFTVKALIVGGPTGFSCTWIGLRTGDDGTPQMACEIPATIRVVAGLQASMVLSLHAPSTVAALPVTAVIGGAQQGQVVIVNSSGLHTRQVTLGASDAQWIEIRAGLGTHESVLLYPTQSDLGQP